MNTNQIRDARRLIAVTKGSIFIGLALLVLLLTSCVTVDGEVSRINASLVQTQTALAPLPSPTVRDTATTHLAKCTVTTGVPDGDLNLREGAGTQYAVITVLTEGDSLTVVARGTWLEVTDTRGNHGFINGKYCQ